ncbi:MAG: hypothetical protein FWG65_02590, partial [Turicibacter sp.]|nr:hypothetical protein [Turicibacter sp.]
QLIMGQRGTVQGDINRTISEGVFSYTDTQIELVFADGEIDVLNFSRTQNTLSLNAPRFPVMQFIRE